MLIPIYGKTSRPAHWHFTGAHLKSGRAKEIRALLLQGMRPTEIAAQLGIARSTLSKLMARYGIQALHKKEKIDAMSFKYIALVMSLSFLTGWIAGQLTDQRGR